MNHILLLVYRLFKPILNYEIHMRNQHFFLLALGQFLDSKPLPDIIVNGLDILEHYPLCYFKYNLVIIKIKQKEDVYTPSFFMENTKNLEFFIYICKN
jgi:hypothetical protein